MRILPARLVPGTYNQQSEKYPILATVIHPCHLWENELLLHNEGKNIVLGTHAFGGLPFHTSLTKIP